jgi:hypothetical protein
MYLKVLQQLIVTVLQLGKDLLQLEQTNKLLKDWKRRRNEKISKKKKKLEGMTMTFASLETRRQFLFFYFL